MLQQQKPNHDLKVFARAASAVMKVTAELVNGQVLGEMIAETASSESLQQPPASLAQGGLAVQQVTSPSVV